MALMSAIIIATILLAITLGLGFSGFFTRLNILDSESKERSAALAEACVDAAILDSANNLYQSNKTVSVGKDICTIISSQNTGGQTLIKTQAIINGSYTNLKVIATNTTAFKIISWDECATFTTCP